MRLIDLSSEAFVQALASAAPTPGGGSAAALNAALGVALAGKFCRTLIGKKKYVAVEHQAQEMLKRVDQLQRQLLGLVDADAEDFAPLAAAFSLPSDTAEERMARAATIQSELKQACEVPLRIMRCCQEGIQLHAQLTDLGIKRSADNLGVGIQQLRAALIAGQLNVLVNTVMINDTVHVAKVNEEASRLMTKGLAQADQVLDGVLKLIKG